MEHTNSKSARAAEPPESPLWHHWYRSPVGVIRVAGGPGGLTDLAIGLDRESFLLRFAASPSPDPRPFAGLFKELDRYFLGEPVLFKTPVVIRGSRFEEAVWETLVKIPWGGLKSYSWVAREAGSPKAARAVGAACSKNRLPIIIPCHRVVRADGTIGGYTGGIDIKKKLFQIENIPIP